MQHLTDSTFEHLTQVRNLTRVHLNQAGGGEIPRKCRLTTCYLRHPLAPPLGIGLYSSTRMSARRAGAGYDPSNILVIF